uniref:Uncharacterized protein n=1 Tax=Poecilia mexicana TaxID=48701 RepID=A0A3B3XLD8_9TELE
MPDFFFLKRKKRGDEIKLQGKDAMVGLDGTTERGETGRKACLCGTVEGEGQGRADRVEDRNGGVREKAEGRGQANGMNRKGLVNG